MTSSMNRTNKDVGRTNERSSSRFVKLRRRVKLQGAHSVYDATDADDCLEKVNRNAGPRPVHFPDTHTCAFTSAGYMYAAASISDPAEEQVPVSQATFISRSAVHLILVDFMQNGSS